MKTFVLAFLLVLTGCVQAEIPRPVTRATVHAEREIGDSAARAFDGVAAVATRCSELLVDARGQVAPVMSDLHVTLGRVDSAVASVTRLSDRAADAAEPRYFYVIGGSILLAVVGHLVFVVWRTRSLVKALHEDVRHVKSKLI